MKTIRLGIIGTGRIAERAISEIRAAEETLRALGEAEIILIAAVNPNLSHAREFALKHEIEYAETDPDSLTALVDAVYIASPHITHYGYALRMLEAGLHVICEKPMAFNPKQVNDLYDLADRKNVILMEGIKTAYCPGFMQIERVVDSGVIGKVTDVEAVFTRLTPYASEGVREYSDRTYGGAFTEFGSYTMLPIFRFLGTDCETVRFESIPADDTDPDSVDGFTKVSFDFGGRFATGKTGLTVKSEGQMVISGTRGYILVPSPWWLTRYFEVRFEDPSKIERYECEYAGDGLRYEFTEFARRVSNAIETGKSGSLTENNTERCEAIARAGIYERFLADRVI